MKRAFNILIIVTVLLLGTSCSLVIDEEISSETSSNTNTDLNHDLNKLYGFKVIEYNKNDIEIDTEEIGSTFMYAYDDGATSWLSGEFYGEEYRTDISRGGSRSHHLVITDYYVDTDQTDSVALAFVYENLDLTKRTEPATSRAVVADGMSMRIVKTKEYTQTVNGKNEKDELTFNFKVNFKDIDYLKECTIIEFNSEYEKIKESTYESVEFISANRLNDQGYNKNQRVDIILEPETTDILIVEHYVDGGDDQTEYKTRYYFDLSLDESPRHIIRSIDEDAKRQIYILDLEQTN